MLGFSGVRRGLYGLRPAGSRAVVALALIACRHGQVTPPETDTDDTVVEDSESGDSESGDSEEPGPCGPGTPAECVEVIDGVCWAPGPVGAGTAADDYVERILTSPIRSFCGYTDFHACGELMSGVEIWEVGTVLHGELWLYEAQSYPVAIYASETRAKIGAGRVDTQQHSPPCKLMYYGDPAGLPCFKSAVDRVNANFEGCDSSSCDPCVCRLNEVTEARYPGCEVAEESEP